jgi:hypothetical protein
MSARNNGHARPGAARQLRRNRAIAIGVVLALILGAFGVGYVLAGGGDETPAPPRSASPSEPSSPSRDPSESPSMTPSETVTPEPDVAVLEDGRHYVYAKEVADGSAGPELTFDLAYFYTGEEAAQVAADRGDESPPPNDYYIVNDNPKLRTMPIAPDAIVRYVPDGTCCNPKAGDLDAWSEAVNGTAQTDYPNMRYTGWWITVRDGAIERIAMQWVP